MRRIAAAVAAIALMAGTAHAQGQGNGKNNDRGGGKSAEAGSRSGGNSAEKGHAERGNRGENGGGPSMAQSMRGSEQRGNSGNATREPRGGGNVERGERGNGQPEARGNGRTERASVDNRGPGNDRRGDAGRGNDDRVIAIDRDDRRDRGRGEIVRVRDFASIAPRGLIDGCPPGLAKKNPPCVPPGQVRSDRMRDPFRWDRPDFWGLSGLRDGRYFYDDGYLVRYAPAGGILGYVPLLGGALSVGNAWPSYYEPVALPGYYERYYGLGPYESYRYADDVIYRVDPQTDAISSIAALLTGDRFAIGQPMPRGYDVYNVPWDYRDRYSDGPDALYRYSDGYVYQVDPKTQLIAAAIELLVS
jgi:hypothetical protein